MLNMTRDEHFPIDGAIEVLEAIPGPKRMGVWAGTHVDIPPEAIAQANGCPGALRSRRSAGEPEERLRGSCLRRAVRSSRARPRRSHPVRARGRGGAPRGDRVREVRVAAGAGGRGRARQLRRCGPRGACCASGALGPITNAGPGIIGVTFLTTYRLAELLAAPRLASEGRRPVSTPVVAAAVRRVLAQDPGPMFRRVATHPATEEALVGAHRELSDLDDAALGVLAGQSARAREVVRIHRLVKLISRPSGTTSTT